MTRRRRVAAMALAVVLPCCAGAAACGPVVLGGREGPPPWRSPGPAADGPIERRVVPDDGFRDYLAARGEVLPDGRLSAG